MKEEEKKKLIEAVAEGTGRILANTFALCGLQRTIRARYEDGEGNVYRMTFEKVVERKKTTTKKQR